FDSAVRRGVESPWERIRALKARTKTPLAMALRGRFLVGSRPVGADFARRFVASAAESGIDVFRLHDPLNDVSNLREAGEAITNAEREFDAGLVYGSGHTGETEDLVEQAKKLPELGAVRILLHDPSSSLEPHRAHELVRVREEVGWPPLAAPIGQILGSQALLNVLSATRYQTVIDELRGLVSGNYGSPPGTIDPAVRRAAELLSDGVPEAEPVDLERLSDEAQGLAASDEELLLLALFGEEARPLLEAIRGRHAGADSLAASGVDQAR